MIVTLLLMLDREGDRGGQSDFEFVDLMPLLSHAAAGAGRQDTPFPSQPEGGRCSPSQPAGALSTLGLQTHGACTQ
jgi:hypothetical protein